MALEALPNNSNELFNFVMIYDTISATPINNNNTYQISSPTTTTTTTTNSTTNNWLPPPPPPSQGIISTNTSTLVVTQNCEKGMEEDDDDGDGDNKELGQGQGHNNGDRMMMMMMMRTRARRRFQEQEQEQEQERRNNNLGGVVRKKRKRKPRVCKNKEEAETQRMTHIAVERNRRKQMNEHLAVLRSLMPDSYVQRAAIADIEVTLIETHASLRIFTRRSPRQLSNLIAGFQSLHLTVLHLNLTTLNPFVLYSLSLKVEEGCLLSSVDDIAAAVHHMLTIIIEEETTMPMCR
ncbi:hypothetical protein F8388_008493 [Cannabis sativa]|uniref:BHLH domain-containing protein n=1 Tax=Cannabis sativa TaxID=3483 RepID=A0A7J6EHU7_CANSA|nr:hypothetical protein F8388_008493 [Cannabis sativa]